MRQILEQRSGLSPEKIDTLCAFGRALLEKNQVMNLTAITEPQAVAELHFLDSIALLQAVDFQNQRVIDIGCGTGGTMRWLSEHFPDWQISGLDKNPDVHEPGWIETGCAEKLPYPDQTADIILMECSCSKAAEPAAALREVYRVLKPEGWLLMSDMYARKKELFLDGMLGRLESAKTIRDRLAEAGFVLAKMQDASGALAEWIGQQIFDVDVRKRLADDFRTAGRRIGLLDVFHFITDDAPEHGGVAEDGLVPRDL